MRLLQTAVYTFDELSDRAKENARDWWRQASNDDSFWSESVIEDAVTIGAILGVDIAKRTRGAKTTYTEPAIYWSVFSSQGDGASFEGSYSYARGGAAKIRKYAPLDTELHRIADALQEIQRRYSYRLTARIATSGPYCHEGTMEFDIDRANPDEESIKDTLRDFARWIYRQLEKECEYQNSDEQVDETIRANEYEFTEDGKHA